MKIKKIEYDKIDLEILFFIGTFGRTYTEVLGKTFYRSAQSARNRIVNMKKKQLIRYELTGMAKPKYSIVLPKKIKDLLVSIDKDFKPKIHTNTISQNKHFMLEQIAFYHLSKIGDVLRTSVWHHKNVYFAVPDMVVRFDDFNVAVEIEMHQKNIKSYKEYIRRAKQDLEISNRLHRFLYVTPTKELMITVANSLNIWDRLFFIDIDTLIHHIKTYKKIYPFSQKQLLKKRK